MLSVIVATHNGADTIDRTLAAMSELETPPEGWKLIVVNNASTDDTEALILKWRDRLPLEYVVEPKLGKSNALNTALERADGDLIVMTDDDVLPDRDWLTQWRRMADSYPDISVFGGAIVPQFDGPPPEWPFGDGCLTVLYGKTPEMAEGEIPPMNISGANLAIRKIVRDEGWRYGTDFLIGTHGLMGEDSDFVKRLWANGHKVGFAPKARIHHIVHKDQVTWTWIHRRYVRHGRTIFMLEDMGVENMGVENVGPENVGLGKPGGRSAFRFPWWRLRKGLESVLYLILTLATFDKARIFRRTRILAYDIGAISQALTLARQQR